MVQSDNLDDTLAIVIQRWQLGSQKNCDCITREKKLEVWDGWVWSSVLELTILSFGLWGKHLSLWFLTVTHTPPPTPPALSNSTAQWHQCEKKTWPTISNNSTTLRAQEDYNVRPIKRIRKISNQRFQGYFPSSHIIFIVCQYLLIICYKYHSTLFIDAQK